MTGLRAGCYVISCFSGQPIASSSQPKTVVVIFFLLFYLQIVLYAHFLSTSFFIMKKSYIFAVGILVKCIT